MNELQTEIVDISEDALDELFNETPNSTPNADNLVGGKKQAPQNQTEVEDDTEDEEEEVPTKKKKAESKAQPQERQETIEDVNLDELDNEEEEEDEEEDSKKSKTKKVAKKAEAEKELEQEEGAEDKETEKSEIHPILKSTVNYLIDSGIWQDFEGREELDVDEETYAKLVAQQDALRVQSQFEELVDSTGPFGKAIIDFVKNGGNPDAIIDLFKEQKQVESISTETPEGQKEMVKHYYSEILGWKPEKIEKHVSRLLLDNELETEAKEVKELFGTHYKKEADKLNAERAEFTRKQQEAEQAFESNIRNTIKSRKDLTLSERKNVEEYLLSYDQRLPNGNLVNKFYVNFAKMQADPAEYIDLVLFVMDKQKFVQKVSVKERSQEAAKAFNFIKGNGAVSNKKGSGYDQVKKAEKVAGFDWGLPNK